MNLRFLAKLMACVLAAFSLSAHAKAKSDVDTTTVNRQLALNNIRLTGGFTFVTSKIFDDDDHTISNPWGYGLGVEYTHLWKIKSSSDWRPRYHGAILLANIVQTSSGYVVSTSMAGLGYTFVCKTNKGWMWYVALGGGYAHSHDKDLYLDNGGFALFGLLGFDYMVNKHLGVGMSLRPTSCFYSKPTYYKNTDFYGVSHFDVRLGFSWHF